MNKTNDLRHTVSKTFNGTFIKVDIRLNDECKNGYEDFAITATIWQAGKPKTDRYMIAGGCCHDEITAAFPEFVPFIRLHLSDCNGVPMYAIANGFYFLQKGFDRTPVDDPKFPAEFSKYYRITLEQFAHLSTAKNQIQFAEMLVKLGVLDQWKVEADAAILQLEQLTGNKFESGATRSHWPPPTPEQIAEEKQKVESGYYTPEAEAARAEAARLAEFDALKNEFDAKHKKLNDEYTVKVEILTKGGKKALDNCIYYDHTQTVSFNWKSYDRLPVEFINDLISKLELPEGVKAEISKNR